jgi:hypothetical protein
VKALASPFPSNTVPAIWYSILFPFLEQNPVFQTQGFNILGNCRCEGAQQPAQSAAMGLKQSLITRVDLKHGIASAAKLALRNEGNAASQ